MKAKCRMQSAEFGAGLLTPPNSLTVGLLALLLTSLTAASTVGQTSDSSRPLHAALLTADMASAERLASLKDSGYTAVVLAIGNSDAASLAADKRAVEAIAKLGLELHYWIEVGRCAELADEHPLWMASLQGHPEWRRFHKEFPQPKTDEVVKCYPWVPVLYQEAFDAHLTRIEKLLADRPPARSLFLNDLQGAPSACGCGNPVCRWTTDYGPIVTATKLGDDAAAKFVAAARKLVPGATAVVPVWVTECEEHDKENDALCAGVGCYKGICWKAYARQLKPLAAEADTLGALLLYKEFGQDGAHYQKLAGWISHALSHGFADQPAKNGGSKIEVSRLIAVLQGWDVSPAEVAAQVERAKAAGAGGYIVALAKIDQSWTPKMVKWK